MVDEFYPFEIDTSRFTKSVKKVVDVHCQFAVSPNCPGIRTIQYASARKSIVNNDDKYKCRDCSNFLSRKFDDNLTIDTIDTTNMTNMTNTTNTTDTEFYPFEIDTSELTYASRQVVTVHCEFGTSPKCYGEVERQYSSVYRTMAKNDGKYICLACSRLLKGRNNNPSCKYKTLDVTLMKNIDSEEKAYFLGWTASDGHISKATISLHIHKKDIKIIETLRDFICKEIPLIYREEGKYVGFCINSIQMATDMARHLKIKPGKKSAIVGFPDLETDKLTWSFIRGVFDGDGSLTPLAGNDNKRECGIASISDPMKIGIKEFMSKFDIYCHISPPKIMFSGLNSLNFLKGIYANAKENFSLERKFARYQKHLKWLPKKDQPKNHIK